MTETQPTEAVPAASSESGGGLARRAGRGMAWAQLSKTLEALLTLAVAVAAVRALNPNAFGLYSLLTYLAGSASVLVPIVMVEAVGAVLPRFRERRERLFLLGVVVGLRLFLIAVAALVLLPGWDVFRDLFGLSAISERVLLVGIAYWVAQDILNSVAGFYLVELEMRRVALWRPIGQAVSLAAIIVVAATEDRWASSVGEVLAAVALGYFVAIAGLLTGLRRYGRPRSPGRAGVRSVLGYARHTWAIGVLTFGLATQVDVILIGAITGDPGQAAFYVIAAGVVGRAQVLLITGWSSLMIPALGEARVTGGEGGLRLAWQLFARLWLMISVPINTLLLVVAKPLVELLFGEDYAEAGDLLILVAAFNIASALLLGPLAISTLWALDRQDIVLRVRIATAAVNIALAVALIALYEARGAVIATGIATLVTAVIELVLVRRLSDLPFPTRFAGAILAASSVAAVPALLLVMIGVPGLVLALLAGSAVFVAMLALLRPLDAEDLVAAAGASPALARVLRRFARA